MPPATASMSNDPSDPDFELPGRKRRRVESAPQSQVVRGMAPVNYLGPDPERKPGTVAATAGSDALAEIARQATAIPDCPECGAPPRPILVGGHDGHAITVHVACQHMLDAQDREAKRQELVAATKIATQVYGDWPPPKRLQGITMADMKARDPDSDDYAGTTAGITVARYYLDNFIAMRRDGCGMVFHGGPGTGKSMLSAAIANEARAMGHYTAWVKIKSVYERLIGKDANRVMVLEALQRVDLLVLDELVSEKDTPAMLREFMRLVDDRYEAGRPTIITSNFPIEQIAEHFDAVLSRESGHELGGMMVERFLSRLQPPRYRMVRFRGPDMRLRLAKSWGPELAPEDE